MKHCLACGMGLSPETVHPVNDRYCSYCADENGVLKPREELQEGIARWLQSMTPDDKDADYMKRADYYLRAMPAFAEDGE
ncbi:MAG: zinc ribbon domain-containing protein [Halanaerobiales bacterium]